jgi:phosphatidyl-myo-inositol dimannoside synthase
MNVVFVITGACATSGGIATHNRQILRVLASLTNERSLLLTVFSLLESNEDRPTFLPSSTSFRGFDGSKIELSCALVRCAISCPLFIFDHVTLALPLLPLIVLRAIRAVIFAHGSESWRRIRRSSRWLFAGATLVLTNSQFTLGKMRERDVRGNIVACPLGLAPEFGLSDQDVAQGNGAGIVTRISLQAASGRTDLLGQRVCLLVGRMHPHEREKGHRELLAVWPEIRREFPNAQLVFAGPGDDRENIAQAAREGGIGDSVFLPGRVSPETLRALYASCYAFTMPSKQEGFGLVYLEAMSAAKPCVGCRDDGAEDVIVHTETGLLVSDPKDRAELTAALRQLLANPDAGRAMGQRGFERLHKHFTSDHVQNRLRQELVKML